MMKVTSMFKSFFAAAALGFASLPAAAFDLTEMSDDERTALRGEIRSYLMENPQVIMDAVAVLEEQQAKAEAESELGMVAANAKDIFEDPTSWVGGNPEGDITLVEFTDYRCGYCRKAHGEVEQLLKSDGNIRFIVKEFPILGQDSMTSARFALAVKMTAGDDAYKTVHDALIALKGPVSAAALTRIAKDAGIDADTAMAKMDSKEVTDIITANHELAQRLQISGTPTFVLDDQMLRGYVPLDGMQQLVAQARAAD